MHIPYLLFEMLELRACPHNVVQQIPHLRLEEIFPQSEPVCYLGLQHELVVIVTQLNKGMSTFAIPLEPHIPTGSKECFRGRRITSLL